MWFVEEAAFNYTQYGEYRTKAERWAGELFDDYADRSKTTYRVIGRRIAQEYDVNTAYLIARSLERREV